MADAVRLRARSARCSPAASPCASTPCTPSPAPTPRRSSRASSGAAPGTVVNGTPLPDFGGHHPDPNLVHAKELYDLMMAPEAPDFGAASDGDGDRNLIIGRGIFVTPVGQPGDARRQRASGAGLRQRPQGHRPLDADQRRRRPGGARSSASRCYETPTGWKFFGNLLDAGMATICGEESAGTGSNHVREKDGLWAVLLWLNILAARRQPVLDIVREHWAQLRPQLLFAPRLRGGRRRRRQRPDGRICAASSPSLPGQPARRRSTVAAADDFAYTDPVDGSVSTNQGIRILFDGRLAHRLPPLGHRHRRGHAARLSRALRARPGPPRPGHADGPGRPDHARRAAGRDHASAPAAPRPS